MKLKELRDHLVGKTIEERTKEAQELNMVFPQLYDYDIITKTDAK